MSDHISVMVVDDHSGVRDVMCQILELGGYDVVAKAVNGVEAVEKYQRFRPELTVMDFTLPRKNGFDATREIMALDNKAKVIMCSSIDRDALVAAAEEAGACGIIFKPFRCNEVLETIDSIMQAQLPLSCQGF